MAKSVNLRIYLQYLEYLLRSLLQRIQNNLGNPDFMQNNAPIYKDGILEE